VPDPTPIPGQTGPPWTASDTLFFYGEWLSNFAPTPGLRLPFGYHGHHERDRLPVPTVEHYFQACKARNRRGFDNVLACGTPGGAKRAGRQLELRPDWEQVKFDVMLHALRGKFGQIEAYRSGLLLTYPRPLAEDSPTDFVWGCRDPEGGHGGENLLGLALMQVRAELVADVQAQLVALVPGR
jgi:ribA/ribD-fused uncharacterized protein